MVTGRDQLQRFAAAARKLMEEGKVDAKAGRFSRTIFTSMRTGGDPAVREAVIGAASAMAYPLVTLEFGPGATAKGPLSITVSMPDGANGSAKTEGCRLCLDGEGRSVLVPRGEVAATYHFAIGDTGLERRHGRPADVGPNCVRALRKLVATSRQIGVGQSLTIVSAAA